MFVGKYYNSIDIKTRLIVPSKFRHELGDKCVVAKALDKCLTIYPYSGWEKFIATKLELLPDSNPQARRLKRHFLSSAAECDVDKQGRLKIPQDLVDYAEISKDLITIGSNKTIEIWSKELWDDSLDTTTGELMSASEIAEGMERYGF